MTSFDAHLVRHPETPGPAVRTVEARVSWSRGGALVLSYLLNGNLSRLEIPPPRAPRRADRLWEKTCFEAFVGAMGNPAYTEFNFSPSGEWAVYAFRGYRERALLAEETSPPKITARRERESLALEAVVGPDLLPALAPGLGLRLGLGAVVEEATGMLSYWSLRHPPGKPDFHHPDGFALELGPPDEKAMNVLDKR